jgi:hypothetical protein
MAKSQTKEFTPRPLGHTSRFQRIATVVEILSAEAAQEKPRWTQSGGAFRKLAQLVADGKLVLEDLSRGTDAYMAGVFGPASHAAAAEEIAQDDPRILPEHPRGRVEYWLAEGTVKVKSAA